VLLLLVDDDQQSDDNAREGVALKDDTKDAIIFVPIFSPKIWFSKPQRRERETLNPMYVLRRETPFDSERRERSSKAYGRVFFFPLFLRQMIFGTRRATNSRLMIKTIKKPKKRHRQIRPDQS